MRRFTIHISLFTILVLLCTFGIAFASVFYLDPELGSDANNGTTWELAWQTITSGATAARIAPGDIIKIKKSPDPVSIGNVTFTDNNATITLASAQTKTIERCEAAWTPSTDVTCSTTTTKHEGTYAATFQFAANFTTGKAAYKALGSAQNFSAYSKITFWIYANKDFAANTFRIDLCSDTTGDTVVDSFTINIATRNTWWIPITLSRDGGGNLGSSIQSVSLHALLDPGAYTIYLDNIEATNNLHLQTIIGKNITSELWWPVRSIVGTTVILGGGVSGDAKYQGVSETAAGYARTGFLIPIGTQVGNVQDSGTATSPITFTGGWNRTTGEQDGDTWFNGLTEGTIYGFYTNAKTYITIERLFFMKYNVGIYILDTIGFRGERIGGVSCGYSSSAVIVVSMSAGGEVYLKNVRCSVGHYYAMQLTATTSPVTIRMEDIILAVNRWSGNPLLTQVYPHIGLHGKDIKLWGGAGYGFDSRGTVYITNIDTKNNVNGGINISTNLAPRHFHNPTIAEAIKIYLSVQLQHEYPLGNYYGVSKYLGVEGDDRRIYQYGEIRRNSAQARGGSGYCAELIPNHVLFKAELPVGPIPATNGVQKTITVYLKKSATYNGNNPKISVRQNNWVVAGPNACAVTTDYQQFQIQYTPTETGVLELIVDADGTTGSIYADDVGYGFSDELSYWENGVPVLIPTQAGGGGGGSVWGTIR